MSRDFLVELGTEELPPKTLLSLSRAFTAAIEAGLNDQGLSFSGITPYATPRRLAVVVADLDEKTPITDVEAWGPPGKNCL